MTIATPMGKTLEASREYQGNEIQFGGDKFVVDLILLDIQEFDVIIRMYFLTKYNASIDYKNKSISLTYYEPFLNTFNIQIKKS